MANNQLYGVDPVNGRSKWTFVDHTGPASYTIGGETLGQSVYGGPNIFGLNGYQQVDGGLSVSGNYRVDALYGGSGARSTVKLRWSYAGGGIGVDSVYQSAVGVGMTPGTYPLVFAGGGGGSGAAGTVTVSATAATLITLTSPGTGYVTVPTVSAVTGGTPLTLLATIGTNIGGEVAATTNLTAEIVRIQVIGG